jgi:hypothetical protein
MHHVHHLLFDYLLIPDSLVNVVLPELDSVLLHAYLDVA